MKEQPAPSASGDEMGSETKAFGQILFDVEKVLEEPFMQNNFFTAESFRDLKQSCLAALESTNYDYLIARYGGGVAIPPHVQEEALAKVRHITGNQRLVRAYDYLAKYQIKDGCIPSLWDHFDQNASQVSLNITIEKTVDWQLSINDKPFSLEENSAVVYAGQLHRHSRPNYPSKNSSDYVIQLFMQFVLPEHWAAKSPNDGFQRFGRDGDIRYFNERRYFPLPEPPGPKCPNSQGVESYANVLNYYQQIYEAAKTAKIINVETVDMSLSETEKIKEGLFVYSINKESAKLLKGLIVNSCYSSWTVAEYGQTNPPEKDTRPDNVFVYRRAKDCHPLDPSSRLANSLFPAFDSIAADYSRKYNIKPVVPEGPITLLRTRVGQLMTSHTDAQPTHHRVVTVVCYYNDDYEGGEIVFPNIGLELKPKAGQILVFPSNFLFEHLVKPVTAGIRYSSNTFYLYKT